MAKFEINPDLDMKLKDSIAHQGEFLYDCFLVWALMVYPLLAPKDLFYTVVGDKKVLPVFSREEDLDIFLGHIQMPPAEGDAAAEPKRPDYELRPLTDILRLTSIEGNEIDTIAFNIKAAEDKATGNTIYFGLKELSVFMTRYVNLLETVEGDANRARDKKEKYFYVPDFEAVLGYNMVRRFFMTITNKNQEGKNYIPVFDNLTSLSRWYGLPDFIKPFKENRGIFSCYRLEDIVHPKVGENMLAGIAGLALNPIDYGPDEMEKSLIPFEN